MRKPTSTPRVHPRISEAQADILRGEMEKIRLVLNRAPYYTMHIERALLNRLGVRTIERIRQPLYFAARKMLRDDMARAKTLIRHLRAALTAREALEYDDLGMHEGVAYPLDLSTMQFIKPVAAGQH